MQDGPYRLVYDAAAAGYDDWWFPAVGFGLLLIFALLLWRSRQAKTPPQKVRILYAGVPFLFAWVVVSFVVTYGSYRAMRDRLTAREYVLVEGTVQDFSPSDSGDHHDESWSV